MSATIHHSAFPNPVPLKQDAAVIGLVGLAHATSHFSHLLLANLERHAVAYTRTHDNETTVGWWASVPAGERHAALDYLGPCIATEPHWTLVRAASQSVVNTVVVPFQDVLGLDTRHRMNTPGMPTGCWEWRFEWNQVNHEPAERLAAMTRAHGRWQVP